MKPALNFLSRRLFLGGIAASGIAASGIAAAGTAAEVETSPHRAKEAYRIRVEAARFDRDTPVEAQSSNGDEELLSTKIGNYSKGLPHNDAGEVDLNAYATLARAVRTGQPADFEAIILGSPDPALQRKLVNPQAGMAFNLEGADSQHLTIPPAPAFSSNEQAADAVELYWQALARDVPFSEYNTNPIAQGAAAELSKLSGFRGPKTGGRVDASTLFRGFTAGDVVGPYISQFLMKGIPFGVQYVQQQMLSVLPGRDYMTDYAEWLSIQNGSAPKTADQIDSTRCYIRNGRDLAQWVHVDVLFQAYFNAMLIMLAAPDPRDKDTGGGLSVKFSASNPYLKSRTRRALALSARPPMPRPRPKSPPRRSKPFGIKSGSCIAGYGRRRSAERCTIIWPNAASIQFMETF